MGLRNTISSYHEPPTLNSRTHVLFLAQNSVRVFYEIVDVSMLAWSNNGRSQKLEHGHLSRGGLGFHTNGFRGFRV